MITLLINTTIIWLCSLVVYELLLKKETFHRLNRAYLLLTFVAGIILPLLPWEESVAITTIKSDIDMIPPVFSQQKTIVAEIVTSGVVTQNHEVNWLFVLYLAGATVSMVYLLNDLMRLWSLYRRSSIRRDGRWLIAETGKPHGPFSILHIIFISSREQYSDQQWQMIVQHEQQHHLSRHILDLALMQVAVIVLWFHPLVYIYRYKLRLLHEYEVDSLQKEDIQTYGRFLLEQSVFSPKMAMTHSFSHSPLKNRIHMMTRNTSRSLAKYRYLLLLPMIAVFILCCTQHKETIAIDIKGRYAMRHDIQLEYSKPTPGDTFRAPGDKGQEEMFTAVIDPFPLKLNGQDITEQDNFSTEPKCVDPGTDFGIQYLIRQTGLESTLKKMADGKYFMSVSDIIVDATGHIAYYMLTFPENWEGMTTGPGGVNFAKPSGLTDADKKYIQEKISETLIGGGVTFKEMKNRQGKNVPYILESHGAKSSYKLGTVITIRNHKLSYEG